MNSSTRTFEEMTSLPAVKWKVLVQKLLFFYFGFAIFLNNWIFIIWALLFHPIWHILIKEEEQMLKNVFPNDYEKYWKIFF